MREKRAKLLKEAREIHQRSVDEKRDMTAEEEAQYNKIMAEIDSLKAKIDREERLLKEQQEMEERTDRMVGNGASGGDDQRSEENRKKELRELAFRAYLAGGMQNLTPEQQAEMRALSATVGNQGGYTVPEGFYNQLIEAMEAYGGMRSVARILNTATGNKLLIPTADNTAQKGRILGESQQIQPSDPSFGQTALDAYKYTSDLILVPIELIQDSAFDIEAWVRQKIAERIFRITNEHFTVGDGIDKPNGIVNAAVVGVTAAATNAVTPEDLIDLEHSVDPAYRNNASFMFHDSTLKALKKLKDAQGRFLWSPGLTVGAPDTILGYRYTVNQDMPQMDASAKSIIFGDLASYWIRDVMDVVIVRFNEKYMDYGQVGFTAFSRHDGDFINAGGNQIVALQHADS
jgi:HK97 family phage major capsid protein